MNEEHGKYINLTWDDGDRIPEFYLIRGHVSKQEAEEEMRSWGFDFPIETRHGYGRWIPAEKGCCYDFMFREYERGRGAFAVTLATEAKEAHAL